MAEKLRQVFSRMGGVDWTCDNASRCDVCFIAMCSEAVVYKHKPAINNAYE